MNPLLSTKMSQQPTLIADEARNLAAKVNLETAKKFYDLIMVEVHVLAKKGKYSASVYFKFDNNDIVPNYDIILGSVKFEKDSQMIKELEGMFKEIGYLFTYEGQATSTENGNPVTGELYKVSWEHTSGSYCVVQ